MKERKKRETVQRKLNRGADCDAKSYSKSTTVKAHATRLMKWTEELSEIDSK